MVTRPVTKKDIPNESRFMTEFWNMIKDFYVVPDKSDDSEDSDQYWKRVLARARQIDKDCNSRMGQLLMDAFLNYLDEKWQKEGADHATNR